MRKIKNKKNHDFSALNADGKTIYYKIISLDMVEVVSANKGDKYRENIVIPDTVHNNGIIYTVAAIGKSAFKGCSGLTLIIIPDTVTSIGKSAFFSCRGLTSITIPDSVISIDDSAFKGCRGLTSIFIPNSVTSIGKSVFERCYGLTSITISNSVTAIGERVFSCCKRLTSINIPNTVTSIGDNVFSCCERLTFIIIPNSVTSIGNCAFWYCNALTSIIIPDSVTNIGDWAFFYCSSLTSILIPNTVTSIGDWAFYGCTALISISVDENNTAYSSNDGVLFDKNQTILIYYPQGKTGNYTVPNSVTSIGDGAFEGCAALISITVDENNTEYSSEDGVLFNKNQTRLICCPQGKTGNYTILDTVTSIGGSAFGNCSGLMSVIIPNTVTSIGGGAFECCKGLTKIYVKAKNPPSLGFYTFYNVDKSIPVYVPAGSGNDYRQADFWDEFTDIIEDEIVNND